MCLRLQVIKELKHSKMEFICPIGAQVGVAILVGLALYDQYRRRTRGGFGASESTAVSNETGENNNDDQTAGTAYHFHLVGTTLCCAGVGDDAKTSVMQSPSLESFDSCGERPPESKPKRPSSKKGTKKNF